MGPIPDMWAAFLDCRLDDLSRLLGLRVKSNAAYVINFCEHGEKVASKFSLAGINEKESTSCSTWNGRGWCLLVLGQR